MEIDEHGTVSATVSWIPLANRSGGMHVVFAFRTLAMFSYQESTIKALVANGHRVQVVVDPYRSKIVAAPYTEELVLSSGGRFTTHWGIQRRGFMGRVTALARTLLSYTVHASRPEQSKWSQEAWRSRLPIPLRILGRFDTSRRVLSSVPIRLALRAFEMLVPPERGIVGWLKAQNPDVLVASPANMRPWGDTEYVKAAKSLKIPTVVTVMSWDNLTARGTFPVVPDLLLVWNTTQASEAKHFAEMPDGHVVITGSPFFDKWVGSSAVGDRDSFCKEAGIPPGAPYVVYLGSSGNIARDETRILEELASAFHHHENPRVRDTWILFRPHPGNWRRYVGFSKDRIVLWPQGGSFPDSDALKMAFLNSLCHSVGTVSVNTSGILDAIVNDAPSIAIMLDRYKGSQEETVHFKQLLDAQVIHTAVSLPETADIVSELLGGLDRTQKERVAFVENFIRPRGFTSSAGDVAAMAIELAGEHHTPSEIDRILESSFRSGHVRDSTQLDMSQ